MRLRLFMTLLLLLAWAAPAWADGTQFNGTCTTVRWNANTDTDLAGYKLYDRVSLTATPTVIATYGPQITSVTCLSLGFNAGQHYLSLSDFDTSGNESARTTEVPFMLISNLVTDGRVTIVNATDMTLAWTEVDDGTGSPATYDVRLATPTIDWGSAASVTSGTCSSPVAGTAIGATKTCTVTGLPGATPYQFQLVPYRGTPGVDAVYGPLSNVFGATTGGSVPPVVQRYTIASFSFTQADGPLLAPWQGGYTQHGGVPENELTVVGGRVRALVANAKSVMAITTILPPDAWCETTLSTITGAGTRPSCQLAVGPPGEQTGYDFQAAITSLGFTARILIWVNGQETVLTFENATTWVNGDVLSGQKIGNVLTLFRNNAQLLTVNDSTYTTGRGGLGILAPAAVANSELDNVSYGGFTTAVSDVCGCDNH